MEVHSLGTAAIFTTLRSEAQWMMRKCVDALNCELRLSEDGLASEQENQSGYRCYCYMGMFIRGQVINLRKRGKVWNAPSQ